MANPYRPKTDFGIEIAGFCAEFGMKQKDLAERAGVKYSTLLDVTTGRSAGHELIPKVRETMKALRAEARAAGYTA